MKRRRVVDKERGNTIFKAKITGISWNCESKKKLLIREPSMVTEAE